MLGILRIILARVEASSSKASAKKNDTSLGLPSSQVLLRGPKQEKASKCGQRAKSTNDENSWSVTSGNN